VPVTQQQQQQQLRDHHSLNQHKIGFSSLFYQINASRFSTVQFQ
jgi:hypothetical protein